MIVPNNQRSPYPQPSTTPISDRRYRLDKDFEYIYRKPSNILCRILIKEGFLFDGASIPRWAWSIIGLYPTSIMLAPSLIHDLLLKEGGEIKKGYFEFDEKQEKWVEIPVFFSKAFADILFRRMMKEAGVPRFRRTVAYYAVRLFGKGAYK